MDWRTVSSISSPVLNETDWTAVAYNDWVRRFNWGHRRFTDKSNVHPVCCQGQMKVKLQLIKSSVKVWHTLLRSGYQSVWLTVMYWPWCIHSVVLYPASYFLLLLLTGLPSVWLTLYCHCSILTLFYPSCSDRFTVGLTDVVLSLFYNDLIILVLTGLNRRFDWRCTVTVLYWPSYFALFTVVGLLFFEVVPTAVLAYSSSYYLLLLLTGLTSVFFFC